MADLNRKPTTTIGDFGVLDDGRAVHAVTLANARGATAVVLTLGAGLHALTARGRDGAVADVIVAPATLAGYRASRSYFGATVGRYANRIAGARLAIDDRDYRLDANEGANTLHGGALGFDQLVWAISETSTAEDSASVALFLDSPDGDQGFPGAVTATATYTLHAEDELSVEYRAITNKPTILNLSNHAYFNLGGEGGAISAMDHLLTIPADKFTPVDATLIPTGALDDVTGTPFDFRAPTRVGARIRHHQHPQIAIGRGYDHNWMVNDAGAPRLMARVEEPLSGRVMDIVSDRPGIQFYSGNFLDGRTIGKSGAAYRQGDALVLEPQLPPDTPSRPAFGDAIVRPGEIYRHRISYKFSVSA